MRQRLLLFFFLPILFASCSFEELPNQKNLKTCQKPGATISVAGDINNFLRQTITLANVTGDVESVDWLIGGTSENRRPNESFQVTFNQAGSYPIKATLKNSCNNNTVVEQTLSIVANAPTLSTVRLENVGQTSAVLVMTVLNAGSGTLSETGILFAESPKTTPNRLQDTFVAGSNTINTEQRITLTNLKPGTTYYANAYAKNSFGLSTSGSVVSFTTSQATPTIQTWAQTFGGSNADFGYHIIRNGAGFLVIGNTASFNGDMTQNKGSYDAWIAQVDFNGTLVWQKSIGGSGDDILRQGRPTSDGNFILVGNTSSNNGDVSGNKGGYDVWLVKISPSGAILWQQTYGTASNEFGLSVETTPEGGYIVVGNGQSTGKTLGMIWYINSAGIATYSQTFNSQTLSDISSPASGQYIISGQQLFTSGDQDGWISRFNSSFPPPSFAWTRTVGGKDIDGISSTLIVPAEGPLVVGFSAIGLTPADWNSEVLVAKLNATGTGTLWQKVYGGSKNEIAQVAVQTTDGGYLVFGSTESNDRDFIGNKGGTDIFIIKLSSSGDLQWQKTLGGSGNDFVYGLMATSDGGYILVGNTTSTNGDVLLNRGNTDIFVVKIDSEGNVRR